MALLQIGDFTFRWGQVYYEWTGHRINERSGGGSRPGDVGCAIADDESCEEPSWIESHDLTYKVWFPGGCQLSTAQNIQATLNRELCAAPNLTLLRQITDDANLERFTVNKGFLEHTDFRFLLSRRRTLTMMMNLNVKRDSGVMTLVSSVMQFRFPGVTRVGEATRSLSPLALPLTFPGVTRVAG